MILDISKSKISEVNLEKFRNFPTINSNEFFENPGKEHYKLLSYLSNQFNNCDIFDIGTHMGSSALALSHNSTNTVHSFDIIDKIKNSINTENIKFYIENIFENLEKWEEKMLNSPLIFLDIDPHDGILEYNFYLYLLSKNYQGIVILDDIHYFANMKNNFWSKINEEHKIDLTKFGHWSGTGILNITNKYKINIIDDIIVPLSENELKKDWTLVTAYFDLAKCPDASKPIKERDGKYYLSHSTGCLNLDYNMVIFCDPEYEEDLKKLRPQHLHSKTLFYPISFEDMKMTKYRQQIIENRQKNPYYFDERNIASYYLLCMARYDAISRIIETNPFNTTHFCWINICIERMGPKNVENLGNALSLYRDKFSTCYIDYISPYNTSTINLKEYYRWGRCSMCSGFFTGNLEYMYKFCKKIEQKFLEFLDLGYGHADEQLFLAVYNENRELFDFYYGDYQQMITNYDSIKEKINFTIELLITKSFNDKEWKICNDACKFVWNSHISGSDRILDSNLNKFLKMYHISSLKLGKYREFLDILEKTPIVLKRFFDDL
jgi:hypothetical protein